MDNKFTLILLANQLKDTIIWKTIESVEGQIHEEWQLFVITDGTIMPSDTEKVHFLGASDGKTIADTLTKIVQENATDYFALLNQTTYLEPTTLSMLNDAANHFSPDIIYSDGLVADEKIYKPDFGIDSFRSYDYLTDFFAFTGKLQKETGEFNPDYSDCCIYDYGLRLVEKANSIIHIPEILYTKSEKHFFSDEHVRAMKEHLRRSDLATDGISIVDDVALRIQYKIHEMPLISILIPTSDHLDLLRNCIDSILQKTTYPNFEIILIENNSKNPETFAYYDEISCEKIKIMQYKDRFNYSSICNFGVTAASGEYYLFLNNDTEIITPDWIQEMLMYAQRSDVGICGAMLYYPNGRIQHAGVVMGLGGVAAHAFYQIERDTATPMDRLKYVQNFSAITGACMMTHKLNYFSVGKLDETFPSDFNDIDYCLKIRKKGYKVVWTPFAELYHYESMSRGSWTDSDESYTNCMMASAYFKNKWSEFLKKGDPYYNKHYSLQKAYVLDNEKG